jgi:branched-chain amino acid transport system permease protein
MADLLKSPRAAITVIFMVMLAVMPAVAAAIGELYYITLFSRILILAIAAAGLNLLLGYAGAVSFGHSLYVGVGAYCVGILTAHSNFNGFAHIALGLSVGGVMATVIGLICLRTSGMAFIMITLAFTQMAYTLALGMKAYGGDDGMPLTARSNIPMIDFSDNVVLYYAIYLVLLAVLFLIFKLVHSRFGLVLRAFKTNEKRMSSLGFDPLAYRLLAYVISAEICVLAGFFLANVTKFVSPSYLQWSLSGELIVMVVLGGMGTVMGPVWGAFALVILEEMLTNLGPEFSAVSSHAMGFIGFFIVLMALYCRQGLQGIIARDRE